MSIEITHQEEYAVLDAIRRIKESTGFGRVVVEIKEGRVIIIETSATVLLRQSKSKTGSRGTRPEQSE